MLTLHERDSFPKYRYNSSDVQIRWLQEIMLFHSMPANLCNSSGWINCDLWHLYRDTMVESAESPKTVSSFKREKDVSFCSSFPPPTMKCEQWGW